MGQPTTDGNLYHALSATQRKILAIAPKCTSPLSIFGSLYVIYIILVRDRSTNLVGPNSRTYSSLLLGLCFADLFVSIGYFLSTWPIPENTINSEYIWGNLGNQTTCNIQASIFQVGALGSLMYTCSLSLHFLLSIRYKWLPSQVKKTNPFLHVACILIPLATAIMGWIKTVFNPTLFVCYIQGYPYGCLLTGASKCIRGESAGLAYLLMLILPIIFAFMFISTAMVLIYISVYHQDQRISRYMLGSNNANRMSRHTFWMACQYVGAFCVSFIPIVLIYLYKVAFGASTEYFFILFWQAILSPLQGFLNAIVYSHDLRGELASVGQSIASNIRSARGSISQNLRASIFVGNGTNNVRDENENAAMLEDREETINQENAEHDVIAPMLESLESATSHESEAQEVNITHYDRFTTSSASKHYPEGEESVNQENADQKEIVSKGDVVDVELVKREGNFNETTLESFEDSTSQESEAQDNITHRDPALYEKF